MSRRAGGAGDLVVQDVKLDVPDPEAEPAVGRDVDAPDGVVPEPRDGEEVADEMLTTVPWAPTGTAYRRIATKSASKRKKRSLNAEEGGGEGEKEGRDVSGAAGGEGNERR